METNLISPSLYSHVTAQFARNGGIAKTRVPSPYYSAAEAVILSGIEEAIHNDETEYRKSLGALRLLTRGILEDAYRHTDKEHLARQFRSMAAGRFRTNILSIVKNTLREKAGFKANLILTGTTRYLVVTWPRTEEGSTVVPFPAQ